MGDMRTAYLPVFTLERMMGVEPTYAAWEAAVLPMNYTRESFFIIVVSNRIVKTKFGLQKSLPVGRLFCVTGHRASAESVRRTVLLRPFEGSVSYPRPESGVLRLAHPARTGQNSNGAG